MMYGSLLTSENFNFGLCTTYCTISYFLTSRLASGVSHWRLRRRSSPSSLCAVLSLVLRCFIVGDLSSGQSFSFNKAAPWPLYSFGPTREQEAEILFLPSRWVFCSAPFPNSLLGGLQTNGLQWWISVSELWPVKKWCTLQQRLKIRHKVFSNLAKCCRSQIVHSFALCHWDEHPL